MKRIIHSRYKLSHYLLALITCMFLATLPSFSQESSNKIVVTGKVLDENRKPLPGATIIVKGSTHGVISDNSGVFSIEVDPGSIIVVSYIGYATQEITVAGSENLTIILEPGSEHLDEVVFIGYGYQRKHDVTGAVVTVDAEKETKDRVAMDLSSVLKGKVSGVRVAATDGTPGGSSTITIRGTTSFNADSKPLYVVDGIITDNPMVAPGDYESITILKDAASTAIYGSRGANGVILITTKRGKKNSTTVDIYGMSGIQMMARHIPMMNSREIVEKNYFRSLIFRPASEGIADINTIGTQGYDIFQDPEGQFYYISRTAGYSSEYYRNKPLYFNNNWQGVMTQVAPISEARINVSGGTSDSRYSLMLNRQMQDGIMVHTGYDATGGRFNYDKELLKWMEIGVRFSYTSNHRFGNPGILQDGIIQNTLTTSPLYPVDFDQNFVDPNGIAIINLSNPLSMAELNDRDTRHGNLNTTGILIIKPVEGLRINLVQSFVKEDVETHIYYPSIGGEGFSAHGRARFEHGRSQGWSSENTASYKTTVNETHFMTALLGFSARSNTWENFNMENTQFSQEDLEYWGIDSGTEPLIPEVWTSTINQQSLFSRLNYSLKQKLIFQGTIRADGSSVFAENNKWGFFPSASAAWRIKEEEFMQDLSFISNLKLRTSWGISGKQAISAYQSLAQVGTYPTTINGIDKVMSSFFSTIENKDLKWERTKEYNIGLDVSFMKERIGVVLDLYHKTTYDLLYADPIPEYTGFLVQMRNIGKINNKGVEFTINLIPVKREDFQWTFDFNISRNISEVLELGIQDWKTISTGWRGSNDQGYLEVGQPLGNWYGLKTMGVWQSQSEIDQAIADGRVAEDQRPVPGQQIIYDKDDNGKITAEDRMIIGTAEPLFTGGFSTGFQYKGITLSANFIYSYGNDIFNGNSYNLEGFLDYNNAYATSVERWKPTLYYYNKDTGERGDLFMQGNPGNTIPLSTSGITIPEMAIDRWIEDGSYLRMQDISLSYNLPSTLIDRFKLSNVRVFVSGSNVFCLTKYTGFDPDVNVSRGMAAYLQPGLDYFSYPRARTFIGGFNVTF